MLSTDVCTPREGPRRVISSIIWMTSTLVILQDGTKSKGQLTGPALRPTPNFTQHCDQETCSWPRGSSDPHQTGEAATKTRIPMLSSLKETIMRMPNQGVILFTKTPKAKMGSGIAHLKTKPTVTTSRLYRSVDLSRSCSLPHHDRVI